ncbi:redoxin domain-containing protein [Stieleria sp. JC731]|uniref:M56 family metallopeptidase n=1 Tax=Pirellulaceae TaxID=2691357 RepID=UPI001E65DBBF|nr:M56 family metallopeptidase [Stieleria sp. JC731]MCC9598930.1 redoxin domain-containing protein [Stieleria sp. JC731]
MIDWNSDQLLWIIIVAKLTVPLLVASLVEIPLRHWNPRLRVAMWRTSLVAVLCIAAISCLPSHATLTISLPIMREATARQATAQQKIVEPSMQVSVFDPTVIELPVTSNGSATTVPVFMNAGNEAISNLNGDLSGKMSRQDALAGASVNIESQHRSAAWENLHSEATPTPAVSVNESGSIQYSTVLLGLYAIGVLGWLCKECMGVYLACRLIGESFDVDVATSQTARGLATKLGVSHFAVRCSDRVASPCVLGIRRPIILLPSELPENAVEAALSHELSHIASRDLSWDLAARTMRSLMWFHPLAWILVRSHRTACEHVSDLVAADLLQNRETYRSALAQIALMLHTRTDSCSRSVKFLTGLQMARRPEIVDRLRLIASECKAIPIGRRAQVIGVLVLVLCIGFGAFSIVLTSANAQETSGLSADAEGSDGVFQSVRKIRLQAIASGSGRSLAESHAEVVICAERCESRTFYADQNGIVEIELPEFDGEISVNGSLYHPGYVPGTIEEHVAGNAKSSATKAIRLSPGKFVSGKVVDEDGQPIAGARVYALVLHSSGRAQLLFRQTTSDDGKWKMDGVGENARIHVEQPDFVNASFATNYGTEMECVLNNGRQLKLSIKDPLGHAVAKANVEVFPGNIGTKPQLQTASDGTIVLKGLVDKPLTISIRADGYANLRYVVPNDHDESQTIELQLQAGNAFPIDVVDQMGQPVEDAWIRIRSNERPSHELWSGKSDQAGSAQWRGASQVSATIYCGADGYMHCQQSIDTSEPIRLVLKKAPVISGFVEELSTKKAIEQFTATLRRRAFGGSVPGTDAIAHGNDGKFEMKQGYDYPDLDLEITAEGYTPWRISLDELDSMQELEIKLKAADRLTGQVVGHEGHPVSGAKVVLTDPTLLAPLTIGQSLERRDQWFYPLEERTDSDGKYSFAIPGELPEQSVLFVEDPVAGFGQFKVSELHSEALKGSEALKLTPWTELAVRVVKDNQPANGVDVTASMTRFGNEFVYALPITVKTDQEGIALFPRVRPQGYQIRIGSNFTGQTSQYRDERMELSVGDNELEVNLDGVPVDIQIDLPPDPTGNREANLAENGRFIGLGVNGKPISFGVTTDDAGFCHIASVPPGHYKVYFRIFGKTPEGHSGSGLLVGDVSKEFSVPVGAERPVIVRAPLQWPTIATVGDLAVPFAGQTPQGERIHSKRFVGQWLLLDWFSTQSAVYDAQFPELKSSVDTWRKLGLNVIGIGTDFVVRNQLSAPVLQEGWQKLTWPIIGDRYTVKQLRSSYGVGTSPTRILINPQGEIVYRGDDLSKLTSTINELIDGQSFQGQSFQSRESIAPDHPLLGIRPIAFDNSDYRGVQKAVVAFIETKTRTVKWSDGPVSSDRVQMVSAEGEIVRSYPLHDQYFPRRGQIAIDSQHGRLYAVDGGELLAFSQDGQSLFKVNIPQIKAVAVDQQTGNLWCCSGDARRGVVIVLSNQGYELKRYAHAATGVIASQSGDRIWLLGKSIRCLDRNGNLLEDLANVPEWTFAGDATIDSKGQLWIVLYVKSEESNSIGPALFRSTDGRLERLKWPSDQAGDSGYLSSIFPSSVVNFQGQLLAKGALMKPDSVNGSKPVAAFFSSDGKLLKRLEKEPLTESIITASGDGYLAIADDKLSRLSSDGSTLSEVDLESGKSAEGSESKVLRRSLISF